MSGLQFVKGLASGALPLNTIAQTLGYDVVEAESGRVAITLDPTGAHLNPWGTVHGGLTAVLLDSCMGLAIQSMLERGVGSTTLEFKISLVRAITLETGQIRAEGRVLNCGRRVGTAEGRVTDTMGQLLAHGTTTCLIFRANVCCTRYRARAALRTSRTPHGRPALRLRAGTRSKCRVSTWPSRPAAV
ncbi:PaaI family thioesterase [Bradyrhizobium sp. CCGUVB1N3]|uniref:PaaI family thioesterase n=1 Tax=Bradyrhizobium sp. CCGUVB1N3 TaxID=2949629 RepID=UPI0020B2596B|nr:PaaI family thioesterase [Bradyrhizobium sp. CCGUVB1N3]MCP3473897.1 PaaI family thioesterase [Bradyrhizobium sp. CCGUVB1N3]